MLKKNSKKQLQYIINQQLSIIPNTFTNNHRLVSIELISSKKKK